MVVPTELTCIEKVGTVWFRFFYSKDGNKNFIFADIWTHVCIFGGEEQSGGNWVNAVKKACQLECLFRHDWLEIQN